MASQAVLCNMHVTCQCADLWCFHLCRSPGADPEIYFASDQHDRRLTSLHSDIEEMLYGSQEAPIAKCTLKVAPRTFANAVHEVFMQMNCVAHLVEGICSSLCRVDCEIRSL